MRWLKNLFKITRPVEMEKTMEEANAEKWEDLRKKIQVETTKRKMADTNKERKNKEVLEREGVAERDERMLEPYKPPKGMRAASQSAETKLKSPLEGLPAGKTKNIQPEVTESPKPVPSMQRASQRISKELELKKSIEKESPEKESKAIRKIPARDWGMDR